MISQVTGLILAGGKSSRMGGVPKGLCLYRNKPLIEWLIDGLSLQVAKIIINSNNSDYDHYGYQTLRDIAFEGPLAGIYAGLKKVETQLILTVPVDTPCLPQNLLACLYEPFLSSDPPEISTVRTSVQTHPIISLLKVSVFPKLEDFLNDGGRKISTWQEKCQTVFVDFPSELTFKNINTQKELNNP